MTEDFVPFVYDEVFIRPTTKQIKFCEYVVNLITYHAQIIYGQNVSKIV